MSIDRDQLLRTLTDSGVVAIIRTDSSDKLLDTARALIAGGVTSVEVTMTTPGALEGIRKLAQTLEGDRRVLIGVGTVLDAATCQSAIEAGARFVVSPHFDPEVVATTRRLGALSLPGAFTPTEMVRAWSAGADIVKVFPSAAVGPSYLRDVLAPLPHLRLVPTGGVDVSNVGDWIRAGAVCVGAGSALMPKDAIARSDWAEITRRASAFVEGVRKARGG